jgi:hypothetical protein
MLLCSLCCPVQVSSKKQDVIQGQTSQPPPSAQPERLSMLEIRCPTKLCDACGSLMPVFETASRRNCHGLAVEHGVHQTAPYRRAQTPVSSTEASKALVIRFVLGFSFLPVRPTEAPPRLQARPKQEQQLQQTQP